MVGVSPSNLGTASRTGIGRRRNLLLGTGIMTLALLLHGLVAAYALLPGGADFRGICRGGAQRRPRVSYIGDYFPYHKRGWATGWEMSGQRLRADRRHPAGVILAGAYGFKGAVLRVCRLTMAMDLRSALGQGVPQPQVELHGERLSVGRGIRGLPGDHGPLRGAARGAGLLH